MIRVPRLVALLAICTLVACSQSPTSDVVSTLSPSEATTITNDSAEHSYKGIPLPVSDENKQIGAPPPAWIVFDEQAFTAHNAAFQTLQAHIDPAEAFPHLSPITIPAQSQFIIIIASNSISEFRASVVQWDPQTNPLPLVESQGQLVNHTTDAEQGFTIYTLTAIYPTKEQFLHVFIAFSQPSSPSNVLGYAHYLWRIRSGE